MSLFDIFQRKCPVPLQRYEDEVLGSMIWSQVDEAWSGECNGIRYLISYNHQAVPDPKLLAYARDVLANRDIFNRAIERAKASALAANPRFAEEIAELRVDAIYFYSSRTTLGIMVDLAGGREGRSWRVEFGEDGCEGIGFDT